MRLRILVITWACDLDDISEPEISARWVQQLSLDHDITLFSVSRPDRYGCVTAQFPELEVIEWQDIKVPAALERFRAIVKPGFLPYYIKARRFLKQLLRDRQFDVVHHLSPFSWRYPSPAAGLGVPLVRGPLAGGLKTPPGFQAASKPGYYLLSLLRKSDDLRLQFDPILRSAFKQSEHVLFAAPYVRDLLAALPIKSNSIEIEHGLTETRPAKICVDEVDVDRQVKFLFVGRIVPTKGLRYAIQAIGSADTREAVNLTVIGDGEDAQICKEEVIKQGLEGRVKFLGWLNKSEVRGYYDSADVFLFPSFREPTGGVLLEAMAFGLPCITCAYGGPDYFIDDSCGIKVALGSEQEFIEELGKSIDRLSADYVLRGKMSVAAQKRAEEFFGWKSKRRRMTKLYSRLTRA
jgi:glycosyltransferase involved in cell wall biosynthesis